MKEVMGTWLVLLVIAFMIVVAVAIVIVPGFFIEKWGANRYIDVDWGGQLITHGLTLLSVVLVASLIAAIMMTICKCCEKEVNKDDGSKLQDKEATKGKCRKATDVC